MGCAVNSIVNSLLAGVAVVWLFSSLVSSVCGQGLEKQEFVKLHRSLLPVDEAWKTVPWEVDLLKARRMAGEVNKPIFIWAMDGHPLGCT